MERSADFPFQQTFRAVLLLLTCAAALFCTMHTIRWPLTGDSAVMHYAGFLASQGKVPYQDFVEPDLPGAYLAESFGMHVFGRGDLGWHVYDLALLALLSVAAMVICRPSDWLAGWMAAVSFALLHLGYGPRNAAQREEVMTVCLLLAIASLFHAKRSRSAWAMLPFGLCAGLASSIKPTACLTAVAALVLLVVALREQRIAVSRYVGLALGGFAAATSLSFLFLAHYHAFHGFLLNIRVVIPYYAKVGQAPFSDLLGAIVRPIRGALLLGLVLAWLQRKASRAENWERCVLLLATGLSLLSHLLQHKNFEHHLYAFYAFVLVFFFSEAFRALRRGDALRWVGVAAAVYGIAVVGFYAHRLQKVFGSDSAAPAMMADLSRLGGRQLSGKVQCFDLVLGCSSALYRLQIVEDPSFANDFSILPSAGVPALPYFQQLLWSKLQSDPPSVIIVTNQQLAHRPGFDKLDQWPDFAALLHSAYSLDVTRAFGEDAYRVYVRKPSPLLATSPASPALTPSR